MLSSYPILSYPILSSDSKSLSNPGTADSSGVIECGICIQARSAGDEPKLSILSYMATELISCIIETVRSSIKSHSDQSRFIHQ